MDIYEMLQSKDPIIFLKRQTNLVPGIRQAVQGIKGWKV